MLASFLQHSLILENNEDLKNELQKLGYTKFADASSTRVFVYVPPSDRKSTLEKIASQMPGAEHDTSTAGLKAGGSMGIIKFNAGKFQSNQVAVKPDKSADLSTDEHESLSAYCCALKWKDPNTNYSIEDFKSLSAQSSYDPKALVKKASQGWMSSSILHAERLYRTFKRNKYVFCQRSDSKFVDNISKAANRLLKVAGKKMVIDKWNPADMWMVQQSFLTTDFTHFDSIEMLNQWLYKQFVDKTVIGVSLKQGVKKVKAEVYNFKTGHKPITYSGSHLGKRGFTKSIDGFIQYNTGEVVLRSFTTMGNISGEIKGRYAAGGKVGFGEIQNIIAACVPGQKLMLNKDIIAAYKKDQDKFLDQMYLDARKIDNRLQRVSRDVFKKEILAKGAKTEPYIVSKKQVLDVISAIQKAKKDKIECAIQKMISYASSSTEVSSVFVKVSS